MKKKNILLILFLNILCVITIDGWYGFDQPKTWRGTNAYARNMQQAIIVAIENNKISIKADENINKIEITPDLKIIQQKLVPFKSIKVNTPVMIQGESIAEGFIEARVILCLSSSSFKNRKMAAGNRGIGFAQYLGHIVSLSPLKISLLNSNFLEVKINDHTLLLMEEKISDAELQVGDKVRMLQGKIIKLPGLPHQVSTDKLNSFKLPEFPLSTTSYFDRQITMAKLNSPFGFFDPNMLRFHHLQVYENFAQTMNDLNVNWAAFGATFSFNWNLLQEKAGDGKYEWGRVDRLIKLSQDYNIHLIGYIKAVEPGSSLKQKNKRIPSLPRSMFHYKKFVSAVVERYDNDGINDMPGLKLPIKYWSIEDEPMAPKYFSGSGADYAKLILGGSQAIKSADPGAKVIVSMIRGTGWHKKAGDPRVFMENFFQQLASLTKQTPYDLLDQHWIGEAKNVSRSRQYEIYENWLDDIQTTSHRYGFKNVPFVNLEMAGSYFPEKTHAANMVKRHVFLLSLGVEKIFWSGLKAAPEKGLARHQKNNYFRQVTLIDGDDQRKLAYWSYKLMVDMLDGADWHRTISIKKNKKGCFVFKFTKHGRPIWAMWNDDGESTENITIPPEIKRVAIVHAVPDAKTGKDVFGYKNSLSREYRQVKNGQVSIELSAMPIFVISTQEAL